ncbi:hypothetical protein M0R45_035393 [Rubus argutus]|uniref:Uncharacterized protein n=1 Tax=Rubus argutus TaxID=59490 RepID=A0AAW1VYF0_RUBAR
MIDEVRNYWVAEIEGVSVKKGKGRPPRLNHLETSITRHKPFWKIVERNQEDFDEFSEVDELYSTLQLDKVESLEDLVTIVPPGLVKGAPMLDLKTSLAASASQMPFISAVYMVFLGSSLKKLREGVTATDMVLTGTQMLKKHGVRKFVEFNGSFLFQMVAAKRMHI